MVTWSALGALSGRRILVTGVTGFLGKVWLGHLLELGPVAGPGLERIHVLVRPGRAQRAGRGAQDDARARLEDLLATSPAFWPLHERHGAELGRVLASRLDVVAGDVGRPLLGITDEDLARLRGRLDLVVHLAGITDLDPDLGEALAVNTDGALAALEVARTTGARLLHVSTAYVAGKRSGAIAERIEDGPPVRAPGYDPEREVEDLRRIVDHARAESQDQGLEEALRARTREALRRHGADVRGPEAAAWLERERDAWVRERVATQARARAAARGWPNVYAMTKALAEALLARRAAGVPLCVVRPTIVESAERFPFPGWKEGLETSGPLTWAMTEGPLRNVPVRPGLVLDVIPVDHVARGLTLAAAALVSGRPLPSALHLGTGATNPLSVARAIDLTALAARAPATGTAGSTPTAHTAHTAPGDGAGRGLTSLRRLLTPEARAAGDLAWRVASVPLLRGLAGAARGALDVARRLAPDALALDERLGRWSRDAGRAEKKLGDLEEMVERFRPFILEDDHVFATDALAAFEAALDPSERGALALDLRALDWRRYWLDVHVPGLKRWVWPRLRGDRAEKLPRRSVSLVAPSPAAPAARAIAPAASLGSCPGR